MKNKKSVYAPRSHALNQETNMQFEMKKEHRKCLYFAFQYIQVTLYALILYQNLRMQLFFLLLLLYSIENLFIVTSPNFQLLKL